MNHVAKIALCVALFLASIKFTPVLKPHLEKQPVMTLILLGFACGFLSGLIQERMKKGVVTWSVQLFLVPILAGGVLCLIDRKHYLHAVFLIVGCMVCVHMGQRFGRAMERPSESHSRSGGKL